MNLMGVKHEFRTEEACLEKLENVTALLSAG
jgi:hypothetical protein